MIYRGPGFSHRRMIWLPPPFPVSNSMLDRRHTVRLRKRVNLLTGVGGEGGRGAKSDNGEEAWSLMHHSKLPGPTLTNKMRYLEKHIKNTNLNFTEGHK